MSSIDERIVAMRFDNAQFEKGVKNSIKTISDLKEATNLDDVAANLSDVSRQINKTMNFSDTAKSTGIFSKALTGLGTVAKKTFNATTFPLQALGQSLKSLGNYTRTMLGIDLASSIVNTGKTVLRAFTIDPLKSGWSEYELKLDSIKTIMTGTVSTYTKMMQQKNPNFLYNEERHLDYVKNGLEELNTYADKTIYSFQDMTSNIGKFTNAGVEFETAVDAIKGIANAAAHAGQGSSQASSAMYNLSQALGMGYLGMMDWRSIENANMATLTFKQTLIDLGTALGKLKKAEDGLTYLVGEDGNIDKNTQVTAENLRETLQKKWVDKEVLLAALGVYSGEYSVDYLQKTFGLTEDVAKNLYNIGQEASKAATQVRTFTKMWDALKEAAQSGWAVSWELIFGDMNEATDFWTKLNDRFSGILDEMARKRNTLLLGWRGEETWGYIEDGIEHSYKRKTGGKDGREILINGLNDLLDVLQRIGGAIGTAWENVFGKLTSEKLVAMTEKFANFTGSMKEWLGSADKDGTRLNKISKGLSNLFGIFRSAGSIVKNAVTSIAEILHLDTLLEGGIDLFTKVSGWFENLGEGLSSFWATVQQNELVGKISGFFSDLWTSVTGFLGGLFEIPTGGSWEDSPFGIAIKTVWGWINDAYNYIEGKVGPIIDSVGLFLSDTWAWLLDKMGWDIEGDSKSSLSSKAKGYLADASVSDIGVSGNTKKKVKTFTQWFEETTQALNRLWTSFKKSDFYKGASNIVEDIFSFFMPKTRYDINGHELYDKRSPLQETIDNVIQWFGNGWERIGTTFENFKTSPFYTTVSTFFSDLWDSALNFFKSPGTDANGHELYSPFRQTVINVQRWFGEVEKTIGTTFENFKTSPFYTTVSTFFSDLWDSAIAYFNPDETGVSPFMQTVDKIKAWFNEFTGAIFGEEEGTETKKYEESPFGQIVNSVLEFIKSIPENFRTVLEWTGWDSIGRFIERLFNGIADAVGIFATITGLDTLEAVADAMVSIFGAVAKIIGELAVFAGSAADVISGKADIQDWLTVVGTILQIGTVIALKAVVHKVTGSETAGLIALLKDITIIAGWIVVMGLAADRLQAAFESPLGRYTFGDPEEIPKRINRFGEFLSAVSGSIGGVVGALIGAVAGSAVSSYTTSKNIGTTVSLLTGFNILSNAIKENDFQATDSDIQDMEQLMKLINVIATNLPPDPSIFARWFGNEQSLSDFGINIGNLGKGLSTFYSEISRISDFNKITTGMEAITGLMNAGTMLLMMQSAVNAQGKGAADGATVGLQMVDTLFAMSGRMGEIVREGAEFRGLTLIGSTLTEGFEHIAREVTLQPMIDELIGKFENIGAEFDAALKQNGLDSPDLFDLSFLIELYNGAIAGVVPDINIQPFADALVLELETAAGKVKAAIDAYLETLNTLPEGAEIVMPDGSTITIEQYTIKQRKDTLSPWGIGGSKLPAPSFAYSLASGGASESRLGRGIVYDASNLDDMPFLSLQNGSLVLSGSVSLNDDNVASITNAVHSEGAAIRSAISGLGGRIDNVAAAINNMQIVLNTGAIVGAVDSAMGNSATMVSRTGIASGGTSYTPPMPKMSYVR